MIRRGLALSLVAVLVACAGPQQRVASSESPEPLPPQRDVPVAFASPWAAAQTATTARLSALRDRVGMSREENEVGVDIVERAPDLLITLVMQTTYDSATLAETFVWRVTPSEMTFLVRYETR